MAESPTCVVEFVDGEITRMTTWSATGKPARTPCLPKPHRARAARYQEHAFRERGWAAITAHARRN